LSTYRLTSPYERPPLRRRASGLALALAINLALLFVLMGLGIIPPPAQKTSGAIVVDLIPEGRSEAETRPKQTQRQKVERETPVPKPPPIVLPVKPTITPPPAAPQKAQPWVEISKADLDASDISKLAAAGAGVSGDSEAVGHGPHGEVLYAAEWARHPTDAELGGYLPSNAPDGYGLIACKTISGNRVEDCVELGQSPGSHLASAVRQAAWQFRVRPPRKNGHAMIGEWVSIRIEYYRTGGSGGR
jgi:periplasmic protein TonB